MRSYRLVSAASAATFSSWQRSLGGACSHLGLEPSKARLLQCSFPDERGLGGGPGEQGTVVAFQSKWTKQTLMLLLASAKAIGSLSHHGVSR